MSIDTNALTYTELVALQQQVNTAVEDRRGDEAATAKKEWLKSDAAKKHLGDIDALKKRYEKLAARCNKTKGIVLKVQMDVTLSPISFANLISGQWERGFNEVFNAECSGSVLNNKKDFNGLFEEIQSRVDDVMCDVCEEAADLHGTLKVDCEKFIDDYNEFIDSLRRSGNEVFNVAPADIVNASQKKAAKKKVAKKGK